MSRLSRTDMRYFQKARQAAELSDYKRTHVGCVAVYQGNIIGIACNTNKTHPMQKYYNRYRYHPQTSYFYPKLHAEINCISSIRHLDINFSKVKLYVYRTRCDQEYRIVRPCPSCMAAIKDLGIRHIYYTTNDGYAYEEVENNRLIDWRKLYE